MSLFLKKTYIIRNAIYGTPVHFYRFMRFFVHAGRWRCHSVFELKFLESFTLHYFNIVHCSEVSTIVTFPVSSAAHRDNLNLSRGINKYAL